MQKLGFTRKNQQHIMHCLRVKELTIALLFFSQAIGDFFMHAIFLLYGNNCHKLQKKLINYQFKTQEVATTSSQVFQPAIYTSIFSRSLSVTNKLFFCFLCVWYLTILDESHILKKPLPNCMMSGAVSRLWWLKS